jgi:hypothetical protein
VRVRVIQWVGRESSKQRQKKSKLLWSRPPPNISRLPLSFILASLPVYSFVSIPIGQRHDGAPPPRGAPLQPAHLRAGARLRAARFFCRRVAVLPLSSSVLRRMHLLLISESSLCWNSNAAAVCVARRQRRQLFVHVGTTTQRRSARGLSAVAWHCHTGRSS